MRRQTFELVGMCDRIYVMLNGAVVAELNAEEANSIRILHYASGEMVEKNRELILTVKV